MIEPSICGQEELAAKAMAGGAKKSPGLPDSRHRLENLDSAFAIALHMHQPLIPAGGGDLSSARMISNLEHMMNCGDDGEKYNASVFADCYGRIGDIVSGLVSEGREPRVMLDYSGELLYGLRLMGRNDILDRLRRLVSDDNLSRRVEWLGTMWGHAVASSTPLPDLALHMRAWQQEFASIFGWGALERVKGFSPPEMHLPNHPDSAFHYVKTLKECGYRWLLVQEHTVETLDGKGLQEKYLPCRLVAKNSLGEEAVIIAIVKTQGSDTKLVAQMQPFYEARGLSRRAAGKAQLPALVTQISDGENGGVMMNDFPDAYRGVFRQISANDRVVGLNVGEYLELMDKAGVREENLPAIRPLRQGMIFDRIRKWEPGAADAAIAALKKERPDLSFEGGSWTNNLSWEKGYEDVITPINRLSATFHKAWDGRPEKQKRGDDYRRSLYYLLLSQTSCFRYWGQGLWTDYAREICRRGMTALGA